jgi:hypothetical protein
LRQANREEGKLSRELRTNREEGGREEKRRKREGTVPDKIQVNSPKRPS